MLDVILVAASLWLCPGDVYTDHPAQGCKEVKESGEKEGFSRSQEASEFGSNSNAATGQATPQSSGMSQRTPSNQMPAASAQECTLYDEYLTLSAKSGSVGAHDLSPSEFERWRNLQQMFGSASRLSVPIRDSNRSWRTGLFTEMDATRGFSLPPSLYYVVNSFNKR
jgi:hypothetical protein